MSPSVLIDAVRALLDVVLSLVPHETARQLLDDAAVRRQNALANAAEAAKFLGNPFGRDP